ncbi:MAG: hemolysin III family protein [Chloroflexota bacterium]|nr:hemolysin III family protein [Chloroflexota bacterium]
MGNEHPMTGWRRRDGHRTAHHDKPLMRGWLHAAAAIGAIAVTAGLLVNTVHDLPRFFSVMVFGLSMILLYAVSSIYHIGTWTGRRFRLLRALDHANIFVLIAGTYTPICVNVLPRGLGITVLVVIWSLAAVGVSGSVLTLHLPRWIIATLYIGMGWVGVVVMPSLLRTLPAPASLLLLAGGMLYTVGAVVYALQRPNPLPRVFGFHEIFHLFVVAGSAAFVFMIWGWVVPFTRG